MDWRLLLAALALVFSGLALVMAVLERAQGGRKPIQRTFQNDDVLRRGKYASRHTRWPL